MKVKPKTVAQYIQAAPKDQQKAMREIRALIRKYLPAADEHVGPNGFPVYTIGDEKRWLAGFATSRKCAMFYVMNSKVLDQFAEVLGKLRTGKSCVQWRGAATQSGAELGKVASEVLRLVR